MTANTWEELQSNAADWNLNMDKFNALKPFFDRMDKDFFARYAGETLKKFPLEEVTAALGDGELERFLLLCVVANYPSMRELYRQKNWPESMYNDIHGDLNIWLETLEKDLGYYGLTPRIFYWEVCCMTGNVKQCGRLQFNDIHYFTPNYSVYTKADGTLELRPAFERDNPPAPLLSSHDKVINLHIPSGAPLKIEECQKSLKEICRFVEHEYPDYDYKAVVCYSWLLDSQFEAILSPESNIVKFQKLGCNATLPVDETREVRWRLWGKAGMDCPLSELSADNSMRRSVIDFLQKGGKFYEGLLIIPRNKLA